MGGTGGPGSDRAAAQSGLQGAGLLSGTPAPSSTAANLGIEGAEAPSSGALSGADGAIAAPKGPTSATDTPTPAPGTPDVIAPPSNVYTAPGSTLVQAPALPASSNFTLAGVPNLGFPTGVNDDTPLGQYTHVPYGKELTPPAITGDAVTGPAVAAAPAAGDGLEWYYDYGEASADTMAWARAPYAGGNFGKIYVKSRPGTMAGSIPGDTGEHQVMGSGINTADWGPGAKWGDWYVDYSFATPHGDGTYWAPNDKTGLKPLHGWSG